MPESYPNLMKPLAVKKAVFRNRIFAAPMTLHALQGGEPYPTEAVIAHYANKARGGAASVTCSGVNIFPVQDDGEHAAYDAYVKHSLHYLAQLADRIHFYGAKATMELGGSGRKGGSPYTVSDGTPLFGGTAFGRQMPEDEMERIAEGYATSALAMRDVGFDMAMVHFGHGGHIAQFLSPLFNKRTDSYGGSLENRARFPLMILDRIRDRVGKDFLIELRISGSEYEPGGIGIEEGIGFAKMAESRIDLIHVSAGMHNPRWMAVTHPSGFLPPLPNVHLAEAVKKSGVSIPVVTVGGVQDLDEADGVIASGKADVVSVARGLIADPELGLKAKTGRGFDVVPCVQCFHCHDSDCFGYRYVCTVNPRIGFEHLPELAPKATVKKRVAVIGGGPAGMEAAIIAAGRGHSVVLFEKSGSLGGAIRFAERVGFKRGLRRFKEYLARQVAESGIELRLGVEAAPEDLAAEGFDTVVAALGASPIVPPIPGVQGGNVVLATDVYGREDSVGKRVAVIGGGQVGCETALHLAKLGRDVTILEMRGALAPDASVTYRGALLVELSKHASVTAILGAACVGIDGQGASYKGAGDAAVRAGADTIVLAAGLRPLSEAAESFRACAPEFLRVGDCDRAANVERAIRTAFDAAANL